MLLVGVILREQAERRTLVGLFGGFGRKALGFRGHVVHGVAGGSFSILPVG